MGCVWWVVPLFLSYTSVFGWKHKNILIKWMDSWQNYVQNISASSAEVNRTSGRANVPTAGHGIRSRKRLKCRKVPSSSAVQQRWGGRLSLKALRFPSFFPISNRWHRNASQLATRKWIAYSSEDWLPVH